MPGPTDPGRGKKRKRQPQTADGQPAKRGPGKPKGKLKKKDIPRGKPSKRPPGTKNKAKYSRASRLIAKGLDPNTPKPVKPKKPKAEKEAAKCVLQCACTVAALAGLHS